MVFLEIMMIGKKKLKLKDLRKSSKMLVYLYSWKGQDYVKVKIYN